MKLEFLDVICTLMCGAEDEMDVLVGRECDGVMEFSYIENVDKLMGDMYMKEDRFREAYQDGSRIICDFGSKFEINIC